MDFSYAAWLLTTAIGKSPQAGVYILWGSCLSSLDHLFSPADNRLRQLDGLPVLLLEHWLSEAGVSGLECIAREHNGVLHGLGDTQAVLPQACDELFKVVYIAKCPAIMKIHRFEGFLRRLLGMEAEIFVKTARRQRRASQCQVATSTGQPFLW
jgi:hypothetical protein